MASGGRGLVVLYSNVDVFTGGKKPEFVRLLAENRPDVVALTEIYPKSFQNDEITESLLSVAGFGLVLHSLIRSLLLAESPS